jgi:hypothetical protein
MTGGTSFKPAMRSDANCSIRAPQTEAYAIE